ncbi:MAG TPA: 3'(2'),5'-bisphosphate nucleotidase CysQ [Saprospiraceae bacterium]|mgnify:CR=1 FL=1|nr:3'(2'),5'-bisphosphate nucleotidase CysQ [Saprospiraceae bacterium]HMQ81637.1 3'(2'),5'-bisphosphate nucleotidase CysQ [Saprospiraceae bacterium]
MNYIQLAQSVIAIAQEAGKVILEIYNSDDFGIETKGDQSPLTLADKAANDVICRGLQALSVQYPIVSEENKAIPYSERKLYDYLWLVDPLDGTKEFIKRNGEFTVNIALIHQQCPIFGVVHVPCFDETYWSAPGVGAFLEKNGQQQALQVAEFQLKDAGLKLISSRSHLNEETAAFINQFEAPELVSKGSSLKFLILAQGEAHIYPRLAPTMEWDTAAAQAVLEAAGGKVIKHENGEALQYNKENLLNPYFIAYGKVLA